MIRQPMPAAGGFSMSEETFPVAEQPAGIKFWTGPSTTGTLEFVVQGEEGTRFHVSGLKYKDAYLYAVLGSELNSRVDFEPLGDDMNLCFFVNEPYTNGGGMGTASKYAPLGALNDGLVFLLFPYRSWFVMPDMR